MKKILTLSIIATASLISISSYAQNPTNNNARNVISTGNTNTTTTTTTTTTVQQQVQGTTNTGNGSTGTNGSNGGNTTSSTNGANTNNSTPGVPATQNRSAIQNGNVASQIQLTPVQNNNETEGNFEANPVTSTPTTSIPEVTTNNSYVIDNQNKRPSVSAPAVSSEKKPKLKAINRKPIKNNTVDSITLEATPRSNGIITSSDVYHLSPSQTTKLLPEQVSANVLINNNSLTYNVYNNTTNESLSSYNFNNLPGLEGQFHLLLIRSDLSRTYGQVFNFSPDINIEQVKVNLPKKFTDAPKNTCDAVILSYQLKNSNEVTNIVNFVQYNNTGDNNESYTLTPNKPQNCNLALPDLQATFTITNNHLVNISKNPKLASEPNKLGLTAHSTESGRLELLKAEQTILISTDFSSVKFLVPQPQKGNTDAMKSFYGLQYSYTGITSNDYLVGIAFSDKEKQEWAWGKINVK